MRGVGAYRITERIGQGGMATVYKAVQVSLDRPVAVKVLSRSLAADPELLERFRRESLIIAKLSHPNIIHVIDRGLTRDGRPYFVMEYVEGTDLARVIREGGMDTTRKLDVMIQVCKAVGYAHKNGVIHLDIKPGNILIDRDGNARVLDFGIAQFSGDGHLPPDRTVAGTVMGTAAYMSPEQQVDSGSVAAASDIYSLGAVMYELFTGRRPVGRLEAPSRIVSGLPQGLDDLILQCLEPDPARRPASADEVRDRLLQILRGAHIGGEQRRRAGQGLARVEEKFALLDVIKEDRYGAVYLYEDRLDHKLLVIKKKPAESSGYTEARMLTTLRHPNVVNVLGTSRNEQFYIVVMEYLSGGSLRDRLVQPFPWEEALRVARGMFAGLAFAHRNRIVHGNLRPSNVLFTEAGGVKLTDFGLEEHYGAPGGPPNWYSIRGEPRSPRADLFAAGTLLYQMLSGHVPQWEGGKPLWDEHLSGVPGSVRDLLERLLQIDPARRPASADVVVEELERILHGAPGSDAPTVVMRREGAPGDDAAGPGPGTGRGRRILRVVTYTLALCAAAGAGYLANGVGLGRVLDAAADLFRNLAALLVSGGGG